MWARDLSTTQKAAALVSFLFVLAVLIGVGLLLQEHGPGNMGNGLLSGAGAGLVACAVVGWRIIRHPERATAFERAFTQVGDERDDALLTHALAVLGVAAVPLTGIAAIAIGFGADVAMIVFFLLMGQVAVGTIAFAVIARRTRFEDERPSPADGDCRPASCDLRRADPWTQVGGIAWSAEG